MKTKYSLLPLQALRQCAELMTDMEQGKHSDPIWLRMSSTEHANAVMRHLVAWLSGEFDDSESGSSHLVHAACRALMAAQQEDRVLPDFNVPEYCPPFEGPIEPLVDYRADASKYAMHGLNLKQAANDEECSVKRGKLLDEYTYGDWTAASVAYYNAAKQDVSIYHTNGDRESIQNSTNILLSQPLTTKESIHKQFPFGVDDGN